MNQNEELMFWERYCFHVTPCGKDVQRRGQALMNALWDAAPEFYEMITGDYKADCFYRDEKIPGFFAALGLTNPWD